LASRTKSSLERLLGEVELSALAFDVHHLLEVGEIEAIGLTTGHHPVAGDRLGEAALDEEL